MFDIVKVDIEDFKSFRGKHSFAFPTEPGLYGITGKNLEEPRLGANGAGKSTLLDAVFWCFYGVTTRGLKAGDVINWAAKGCKVTVHVLIGNDDVTVTRSQSPNSLRLNNQPVDQDTLQKTLRIGPEAFMYAVMIPQFGKAFFELSPGDKLTLFSRLLELDYWLDKSKEAATLVDELITARNHAERETARHKGQLETIDGDIEALRAKDKSFAEAEVQRIKGLKQQAEELKAELVEIDKSMAFTDKALKGLVSRIGHAEHGDKKCPTCGQRVPNKDLNSLLTNQADFEQQWRKLEHSKVTTLAAIKGIDFSKRENPYAGEITRKQNAEKVTKLKIADLKREIDTINEDATAVSFWVSGFKRVRLFIVEETLRQLELEINNALGSLGLLDWHIELDVERENKSGGITKGFTVLVHAPGAPGPVKLEAWSGGETQRLLLAGDLGLANLIMERAGLSNTIEFFDEPSRHLSQEGILDLAETLMQRAIDSERRVCIIEHSLLDYPYTGIVTVVKDSDGSHIELN